MARSIGHIKISPDILSAKEQKYLPGEMKHFSNKGKTIYCTSKIAMRVQLLLGTTFNFKIQQSMYINEATLIERVKLK